MHKPFSIIGLKIGHGKDFFNMWWTFKKIGLLLHIINNYKVHNIFQFFKKKLNSNVRTFECITCPKFVEKIFNFLMSNVSITHFLCGLWPMNYLYYKVHISLNINVIGVIILKLRRGKKVVSFIWVHFCWNFQLTYGFY
jgi:hypothetical protein